jgi:hypothetical protein
MRALRSPFRPRRRRRRVDRSKALPGSRRKLPLWRRNEPIAQCSRNFRFGSSPACCRVVCERRLFARSRRSRATSRIDVNRTLRSLQMNVVVGPQAVASAPGRTPVVAISGDSLPVRRSDRLGRLLDCLVGPDRSDIRPGVVKEVFGAFAIYLILSAPGRPLPWSNFCRRG